MEDFIADIFAEQELFGDVANLVDRTSRAVVDNGPELAILGGSAVAGVAGVVAALAAAGIVTAPVAAGAGVVVAAGTAVAAGGGLASHLRDSTFTVDDVTTASTATIGLVEAIEHKAKLDSVDDELEEILK